LYDIHYERTHYRYYEDEAIEDKPSCNNSMEAVDELRHVNGEKL
jgi:hypothetical protein